MIPVFELINTSERFPNNKMEVGANVYLNFHSEFYFSHCFNSTKFYINNVHVNNFLCFLEGHYRQRVQHSFISGDTTIEYNVLTNNLEIKHLVNLASNRGGYDCFVFSKYSYPLILDFVTYFQRLKNKNERY